MVRHARRLLADPSAAAGQRRRGVLGRHGPYAALQTEDMRESVDKKAVLNGAFGVELLPYGDVTLRAGVYTDRSSRRSAAVESLGDIAPDYWVYTGSLGYEAPRASIVFGMAWQTGSVDTAALSMRRDEIRWWVAGAYKL